MHDITMHPGEEEIGGARTLKMDGENVRGERHPSGGSTVPKLNKLWRWTDHREERRKRIDEMILLHSISGLVLYSISAMTVLKMCELNCSLSLSLSLSHSLFLCCLLSLVLSLILSSLFLPRSLSLFFTGWSLFRFPRLESPQRTPLPTSVSG